MREKWILETKRADFDDLAGKLGISPLAVRCMVNRGVMKPEKMRLYLNGTREDLPEPYRMKGMERAVELIARAKERGERIAIASDFDCDGIFSAYILWKGFGRLGMDSRIYTPDRVKEGYGLNERIVREACADGRSLLVTCDNGIAAKDEVKLARQMGLTVLVTDHHEVQGELPEADGILDPKQEGETYPYKNLCGCGVAFKLLCALYDRWEIPEEEKWDLLEYVAIATVADVMELMGENRILVKEGLAALKHTKNTGLRALLTVMGLGGEDAPKTEIRASKIGFVIGPCFNAPGRISTVAESFGLLMEEDWERALERAEELKSINEERKAMTEEGAKKAFALIDSRAEREGGLPSVLLTVLPDTHESLAGIIAGRVKERYHHPAIIFTETEGGMLKGSGRSIESYDMFQELFQCSELFVRFGGHKMAAGLTLPAENIDELSRRLNEQATLTEDDFCPEVRIDAAMPIGFATERLVEELNRLEPFGTGNPKPVFAEQHFKIRRARRLGKEGNILKFRVENDRNSQIDALLFWEADRFDEFVREIWGERELSRMYEGRENNLDVAFTYYPMVDEYQGMKNIQIQILNYCHVPR